MRGQIKIYLVIASLLFAAVSPAGAQECAPLEGASPDELATYLDKTVRAPANEACAAFAINQLASQRYAPAAPALTKWLELRWPPSAHQKQRRFVIEREGFTVYPAAAALELMGKEALPAVLAAIKTNRGSREWMEVAAEVWMTAYKDHAPMGVALLKQESDRAQDPAVRVRSGWAAYFATWWCDPSEREKCTEALRARSPN